MSWIDRVIGERTDLLEKVGKLDTFMKLRGADPDADRTLMLLLKAQRAAMMSYVACLDARLEYMGCTVDSYETVWGVPNAQDS